MTPIIIVLLALFAVLTVLFFGKFKIVRLMDYGLKLAFPVLLLLAGTAIFLPQGYESLADSSLQALGVLTRVRELDQSILNVTNLPQNIGDQIQHLFGGSGSTNVDSSQIGYVETNLYPTLVASLALAYRAFIIIVTFLGMCAALYLSYTTASLSEVVRLRHEYSLLKKRLDLLEHKPGSTNSESAVVEVT